ncbi:MAG TPA: SDR family NAD(P)-dependent oxidoreductase [Chloroflexia bacterium]|nr:SDR family NAD(P)-dependent oxidoreductase [Chloroflexia bacterium]
MLAQPEFKLQVLDATTAGSYQLLTYKKNYKMLSPEQLESATVAIGASVLDIPVGLVLASLDPARQTVKVISIFVGSHQRKRGIGKALLEKLEKVTREKGYTRAELNYLENLPACQALENLLGKCGWSKPALTGLTFEMTPGKDETGKPKADLSSLTLPEGCTLFKWADLTEIDKAQILELVSTDSRYKGIKTPRFEDFEPLNSLGLRYQGQIVGWQLTSRLRPDTIAYDGLFVRSDIRNQAGGNSLMLHAVALQQQSAIPVLHWQIEIFQKHMIKLVENIVSPYPNTVIQMRTSQKEFKESPSSAYFSQALPEFNSLGELLRWRTLQQPLQTAFTFLPTGGNEEIHLTYGELDRRARQIGLMLRQRELEGQPVLLTLSPGLDWISAFFGCLYAGAIPVLAYTPDLSQVAQSLHRLEAVVQDCGARVGLTNHIMRESMELNSSGSAGLTGIAWLSIEQAADIDSAGLGLPAAAKASDLAFLLYTSGSTGSPKGVMISHANALGNIRRFPGYQGRPLQGTVSWLSPTHTMGLFFGILHPLFYGVRGVILPSWTVMQRPASWLEALSRYGASATVGSNFAFELCCRKITPAERRGLDLSRWNLALSGGEPVSSKTLQKFTETFQDSGFRPETFYPSYGMSEATNAISGASGPVAPTFLALDKAALAQHAVEIAEEGQAAETVKEVVGCGFPLPDHRLLIVDPDTMLPVAQGKVGEIWLSGPGVAEGYWQQPEATAATFQAKLAGSGEGPFLRTGDLGFMQDGQVYVAGRLKELIIVHGRKHYPQDIEASVEQSHPAVVARGVAAFALEIDGEEKLGLACETDLSTKVDAEEIISAIRFRVASGHDLEIHSIALVKPGSLPRTAGQKLQRRLCRELWQAEKLEISYRWQLNPDQYTSGEALMTTGAPATGDNLLAFLITQRLKDYFARRLSLEASQIDVHQSFAYYGLVSLEAVNLINDLEKWLKRPLSPTLTWEYPNIAALSNFIAGFAAIQEQPAPSIEHPAPGLEPVAVVGIGCRFPGARNKTEFWELLCEGRDSVTEVPSDRWNADDFYDPDSNVPGKMTTRWGGFLPDLDQFEPLFFNISPREAVHLDPRQRLILESAWEALEDAGIAPDKLAGSQTGIFISTLGSDYGNLMFDDIGRIEAFSGAGAADSILANRLSYFLDLQGPSLSLDTACSGSLVAVHLACQSIRSGESSLALVGGVNVILKPDANIFFSKAEALAPDGRCKVFDARANGIVRSEGAGVVVLKALSQALADGDQIYAVIRGSAVNSDGRSKGIMAPDKQAQQAVLRRAYQQAGVSPGQVQYVEAHGTGTRLGDPIEVQALGSILSQDRPEGQMCALGSLKSNIGHTEAAAGIAGLIKVALSLKNRVIPPNLHYQKSNPLIPFDELPLVVQTSLGAWPQPDRPLLAGVSSFGFGGTNAHVVLEEAPAAPVSAAEEPAGAYLLPLSAQNDQTLKALALAYRQFLEEAPPELDLADVCYTAGQRRNHFSHRLALVGTNRQELLERLRAIEQEPAHNGSSPRSGNRPNRLVMVFSGQGSHWLGMGQELMDQSELFRESMERCDALLRPLVGWSLLEELTAPEEESRLNETDRTQPAIFAIQVSLAALWKSFGIIPDAIVGQSLGEVAAACVSGVLTLPEAILVVAERSRLMKTTSGKGKTALVELPFEQAQLAIASCSDVLAVAGSNSPTSSILSGDPGTLEKVLVYLQKQKVFCKMLPGVDVAFHSPQMEPIREELVAKLAGLKPQATAIPLYSSVTGQLIAGEELNAAYWGRNLRDPFLFSEVVKVLAAQGFNLWLEVSPHPVLSSAILQGARLDPEDTSQTVLNSLRRGAPERASLLASLGTLYSRGYNLYWSAISQPGARCVTLPTYPWQRQRYWFDQMPGLGVRFDYPTRRALSVRESQAAKKATGGHPLLAEHLSLAFSPGSHVWSGSLSFSEQPYLADHQVQGLAMLPGSAYLEMALAAARQVAGSTPISLGEVVFKEALIVPAEAPVAIQLSLLAGPEAKGLGTIKIASASHASPGAWRLNSSLVLEQAAVPQPGTGLLPREIQAIQERCRGILSKTAHYERMESRGLHYGPAFQAVEQIWYRDGESLAQLRLPVDLVYEAAAYNLHPALLDASFQAVSAAFPLAPDGSAGKYLPVGVRRFTFYGPASRQLWSYASFAPGMDFQAETVEANISLLNEDYKLVATIEGLRLKRLRVTETKSNPEEGQNWLYKLEWQALEAVTAAPVASKPGSSLIFGGTDQLGAILSMNLEAQGETCLMVCTSTQYRFSAEERAFQLDPTNPEHFRQMLADLEATAFPPLHQVLYLWGVEDQPNGPLSESDTRSYFEASRDRGSAGLLHLVQALTRHRGQLLPRLWVVTNGYAGLDEVPQQSNLAQAPLWGLAGVVLNEHPELRCSRVDLSSDPTPAEILGLLDLLAREEFGEQWALRGEVSYVQRLVRSFISLPTPGQLAVPGLIAPVCQPDATYLVTGGLGGLGLAVAEWLVEQGARHLLLLGRSRPSAEAQGILYALEAQGIQVAALSVDVTEQAQLAAAIASCGQDFPPLKGIIHAAAVIKDGILTDLNKSRFDDVLAPKMLGAWNLHQLSQEQPLDFFVMFSSMTSILGVSGQSNYVAANTFLDRLALYRQARGLPAVSINWGPWSDVGQAALKGRSDRMATKGIGTIKPEQGLLILGELIRQNAAQIAVIDVNWKLLSETSPLLNRTGFIQNLEEMAGEGSPAAEGEGQEGPAPIRNEILALQGWDQRALVESYLSGKVCRVLGLEGAALDLHQSTFELGFDSLMTVELKVWIEKDLNIVIPAETLLQGPSIYELAGDVVRRLTAQVPGPVLQN